jgi:hypothetical protein
MRSTETYITPEKGNTFETALDSLPDKYRAQILRQYDLPKTKATMLDFFRWATLLEIILMIIGGGLAIGSGQCTLYSIAHA